MTATRFLFAALLAGLVHANDATPPIATVPRDPYVPPAARRSSSDAPAGAALQAKVTQKLAARFANADAQRAGTITREQARRAHWGYVADNFDRIDAAGTGRVSLDDVKRYMRANGATF